MSVYANDGPAARAFAVTPANTDFTGDRITRGLYIGGTGNVDVVTRGGDAVTFSAVPAGTVLPVQVTQVKTTTTATLIVALY